MSSTPRLKPPPSASLLSAHDVLARVRLSQRQLDRLVAAGTFPAPVRIGRLKRWRSQDVDRYVDALSRS